ncbi:hypothetical protein CP061683_0276B, partial [Chlamydia psittaci 06-1683]
LLCYQRSRNDYPLCEWSASWFTFNLSSWGDP